MTLHSDEFLESKFDWLFHRRQIQTQPPHLDEGVSKLFQTPLKTSIRKQIAANSNRNRLGLLNTDQYFCFPYRWLAVNSSVEVCRKLGTGQSNEIYFSLSFYRQVPRRFSLRIFQRFLYRLQIVDHSI
jgi:hypothetical protein